MPALIAMANIAIAFGHARRELARVCIKMTSLTTRLGKYKKQFAGQRTRRLPRVANAARRREVRAPQGECGFLMFRQFEL